MFVAERAWTFLVVKSMDCSVAAQWSGRVREARDSSILADSIGGLVRGAAY